jgi:hypothetical protein
MTAHDGSVTDVGELQPNRAQPTFEFTVGPDFEAACRDFRANLPKGVKLAVGLTPSADIRSGSAIEEQYRKCWQRLDQLLRPDALLTNLPVTLPVTCFSQTAHLNASGQQLVTKALAKELAGLP